MRNRRTVLMAALAAVISPLGRILAQPYAPPPRPPMPPPRYEPYPPRPPGAYRWHWVRGRWRWNGYRWVSTPGRWVR